MTQTNSQNTKHQTLSSSGVRRTVLRDACLIMFVALSLFGANNYYTGYAYLGFIDAALALGMLINAWRLQRMDSEKSGALPVLLAGAAATLVASYANQYGVYWSYIAVAVSFLVLERRPAAVFNLIFIILMTGLTAFVADLALSARVGITLSLLAAISYIFSGNIEVKNQQLLAYSSDLEKADAAKSEFIENMSHEMRTPLTTIMGYSEMMLSNGECDSASREKLAIMFSNAKSLSLMIEDVLDLTRIESGHVSLAPVKLELAPYLREVSELWSHSAEEKGIDFSLKLASSLPSHVKVDQVRLNHILSNLLGNAIKFTDSGSVQLMVEYMPRGNRLKFGVLDTGIGIPEEFRDSLFEKFSQYDSSKTRRHEGIGLGLFISKNLAVMLGADLVHVPQDTGCLFELSLPINSTPEAWIEEGDISRRDSPPEQLPAPKFSGHILIAEDSGAIQLLLGLLVEQMGMSYKVVDNGQAAVDIMHAEDFDLVLMDLQMPILSGIDATAAIRLFNSSIPIVALSSDVLLYDKDAEQLTGFSALLPKPVEMQALQQTFEKLLPVRTKA